MSANSFGERFCVTTFGESHGVALGCVIDGMPAGVAVDEKILQLNLERRRPGQSQLVTARNETDHYEILSGVFAGKTLGTPIAVMVRNQNAKSQDYSEIKTSPRAGHADDVWKKKFLHTDHRGGGRSSGRETLARVIAGSFAQMFVQQTHADIHVKAFARQIGPFQLSEAEMREADQLNAYDFSTRFPSARSTELESLLTQAKENGESYGGVAQISILNPPHSLGQPVFHKLKSDLAKALMSVGAVNGVEFGAGFALSDSLGTKFHNSNEAPTNENQKVYGGLRGGISTGEKIILTVSVKPTSSILDVAKKGRHDPCILIRALPVFESMIWLTLADHILWRRTDLL